jgi:acetyl esterase/lipase
MKNKLRPLAFFSRLSTLALVVALLFYSGVKAQDTLALYPGLIPNAKAGGTTKPVAKRPSSGMVSFVSSPSVEIYLPEKEKATGAAVIICPGGSYVFLAYQNEGVATAKEFQKNGVAAFVLKYRLPNDAFMNDKKIVPMMDAEQAIKVVRQNATHWGLDTHRVGLMGFSAGGHLASTVATHFKKPVIENKEHINLRPDFLILVYPVISMQDKLTHKQSRTNLLGKDPSQELKDEFSNEMQVDADTPPTCLNG